MCLGIMVQCSGILNTTCVGDGYLIPSPAMGPCIQPEQLAARSMQSSGSCYALYAVLMRMKCVGLGEAVKTVPVAVNSTTWARDA